MRRVRLTGKAGRFLRLMQDFGHLDPASADELLLHAAEVYGGDEEVVIDTPVLKRVVAGWLLERSGPDLDPVLEADWGLVFS